MPQSDEYGIRIVNKISTLSAEQRQQFFGNLMPRATIYLITLLDRYVATGKMERAGVPPAPIARGIIPPTSDVPSPSPTDEELPEPELRKLGCNPILAPHYSEPGSSLNIAIYNGSTWLMKSATVRLFVLQGGWTVLTQDYDLSPPYPLAPRSAGSFTTELELKLKPGQSWTYQLLGAKGRPQH
jgi:hypothetical protein